MPVIHNIFAKIHEKSLHYLLYEDVKTVKLELTFQDKWEVAYSNAYIKRLLFMIITFLKINSKRIRDFKYDWWEDNRISV